MYRKRRGFYRIGAAEPSGLFSYCLMGADLLGIGRFNVRFPQEIVGGYVKKIGEEFQMMEWKFVFFAFVIGIILS